ncbi:response regulator [uncultured Blautia sp.]|uniref:response regulator n=1 Tax=uncultured Blautia sp. TaxID=765821 RepID=UPI00280C0437|nr:response regulator [uncultured Blautia sp.]
MKEKIMIIEDDPLIRNELKTLLKSNSYEIAAPEDFSGVIDQIKADHPHLILLDIKLPGTSGFSLCSQIRTFSQVPIIFVTSCTTDMDELNSIMLGGDAFITKPYNTAILLAKIASLLKKAYPAQQREQIVYGDAVLHLESSSLDTVNAYGANTPTKVDRNQIVCTPIEIRNIQDDEQVREGIENCIRMTKYSLGIRTPK